MKCVSIKGIKSAIFVWPVLLKNILLTYQVIHTLCILLIDS